MDSKTLDDIIKILKSNLEATAQDEGLASWSEQATEDDITEHLDVYSLDDLRDLREELEEGTEVNVTLNLTDVFIEYLDKAISQLEKQERTNSSLDEDEDDYEEYDLELDFDDEDDEY